MELKLENVEFLKSENSPEIGRFKKGDHRSIDPMIAKTLIDRGLAKKKTQKRGEK